MTSQLGRRLTRHTVGLTGLIAAVLIMTSVMVLRPLRAADVTKSGWWIESSDKQAGISNDHLQHRFDQ